MTLFFFLALYVNTFIATSQPLSYPFTPTVPVADTMFGTVVHDPYRWLENDNNPEVERWVQQQKALADTYLAQIPFREKLAKRVKQLSEFETISSPWRRGKYTFYYRNNGKQNHSVLIVKDDSAGKERILLDPNTWSDDGTIALAFASENEDGTFLAFGKTQAGSDWRTIHVLNIETGEVLSDEITGVKNSGVSWYGNGFFYNRYPVESGEQLSLTARNSGQYVCYHGIGTQQSSDRVVFRDSTRPTMSVGVFVPKHSPYLVRWESDEGHRGNRLFVKNIGLKGDWDVPGEYHLVYDNAEHGFWPTFYHEGKLYGVTDLEAENKRVVVVSDITGSPTLRTLIPESEHPISGMSWGGGRIFITRMVDVHDHVSVYDVQGTLLGEVDLPGKGNAGGFWGEPDDTVLYYTFSSFTIPTTIYRYSVQTNSNSVYYTVQPPFNPGEFEEHQVWVTSKDGTRIPMFVLHKKGLAKNGEAPTMIFGYGGFGITYGPGFNANYIAWLEQGGVVAIPNLRGGGEYGERWHDLGRKEKKQNVFDDCIAAAEWLIANGYTRSDRLALNGRSNGGLLVGAVMLQRPDLFRVAVPEVGVLDMLRYHLFTIGRYWVTDYGSVHEEREFRALYKYSPYHNVQSSTEYPSVMVMTSDHDDRVVPAHSFKFVAALQREYSGSRPRILRVEEKSGHGAVNKKKALDNITDKYAFMWWEMGFTPDL